MFRGFVLGLLVAAVLGGIGGLLLAPRMLNHKEALPLEERLGRLVKQWAVPDDARGRQNPLAGDATALAEGRRLYGVSCLACHGQAGDGRGTAAFRNMFPPPASLISDETKALTDGELYWFIQNGISFVGMPSFGITTPTATAIYNEQQIWQLVAYVRALQSGQNVPPPAASPAAQPGAAPSPQPGAAPSPTPAR